MTKAVRLALLSVSQEWRIYFLLRHVVFIHDEEVVGGAQRERGDVRSKFSESGNPLELTEEQKALIKLFDVHSRLREVLDFLPTAAEHLVEAGKVLGIAELTVLGQVLRHSAKIVRSVQNYLELRYDLPREG